MGILQARILEWVAISSSRGSSQPRDWTQVSLTAQGPFTRWATREACQTLSSVQFMGSVMSDSLQPHGLQHARLPCLSPTSRVYPNPCPLSWWCHPTISSSLVLFSSRLQSFPASGSFQMSQFFTSGGLSTGVSASHQSFQRTFRTDFLQDGLVGPLCSPRDSQESSQTPQFKGINSSALSFLYSPTLTSIHHYWKNHSLD